MSALKNLPYGWSSPAWPHVGPGGSILPDAESFLKWSVRSVGCHYCDNCPPIWRATSPTGSGSYDFQTQELAMTYVEGELLGEHRDVTFGNFVSCPVFMGR